ncbi:MAG: anaerobic ribonucleoside-triphosphate reductase [Acutalibacteraceae bacterium]|jgi:hypothetical protein
MTDINVTVKNGELSQQEIDAYIAYGHKKYPGKTIKAMDINVDGEYVDIDYTFEPVKFDRIRRITGYLVGTTERFNNAKKAEVQDRVKHTVDTTEMEQI